MAFSIELGPVNEHEGGFPICLGGMAPTGFGTGTGTAVRVLSAWFMAPPSRLELASVQT